MKEWHLLQWQQTQKQKVVSSQHPMRMPHSEKCYQIIPQQMVTKAAARKRRSDELVEHCSAKN